MAHKNHPHKLFPSPRTAEPSVQTKELQREILALRKSGMTLTAIAIKLDKSQPYVSKLYRKALKSIIHEDVEGWRKLELERLDLLQSKAMEIVLSFHPLIASGNIVRDMLEDANGHPIIDPLTGKPVMVKLQDKALVLTAINTVKGIMDQRARLLGLNAPTKTALTNAEGNGSAALVQVYLPSNSRENYGEEGQTVEGEVIADPT